MDWCWVNLNLPDPYANWWSEAAFRKWKSALESPMSDRVKEVIPNKLFIITGEGWNYVFIHRSLLVEVS